MITLHQKNKKKIAIIDMDDLKSTFWGAGQARATRETFKRLVHKYDVTVYTAKYPSWQDYTEDGMTYQHVGIEHASPRLTNAMFILTIPWLVRQIQADIIFENFNAPISASGAPLFTSTPIIGIPTMFNAREFSKKYHLPFHLVEWLLLQTYRYMVAYSDIDSAKIATINSHIHYRVIPQGVGEEYFQIPHKTPKHILFIGRFDIWQKGIDLLLHAYARIKDRIQYPLVIAGKGPDEHAIRQLIRQLGIEDKVSVQGAAYGDTKHDLLSKALCVAFPSRHDELSLWALEALGAGVPLITFDLPEGRWMTPDSALKAKPFDIDAYAENLIKIMDNTLNAKMRNGARALASQYTWEKVASLYDNYISDIISKKI